MVYSEIRSRLAGNKGSVEMCLRCRRIPQEDYVNFIEYVKKSLPFQIDVKWKSGGNVIITKNEI